MEESDVRVTVPDSFTRRVSETVSGAIPIVSVACVDVEVAAPQEFDIKTLYNYPL